MFRKIACVSFLALSTLIAACGGEAAPSGDETGESDFTASKKVISGETGSFKGSFAFDYEGAPVKMQFGVSKVDWEARTAVFDSTIVEGKVEGLSEDKAVAMEIAVMRCPGCYSFKVVQDEQTLLEIAFEKSALKQLTYSGIETTSAKITETSKEGGGGNADPPEGFGQRCGGFAGDNCPGELKCVYTGLNEGTCQ